MLVLSILSAASVSEPAGSGSHDARALCNLGDALFRNAEFEGAERCYLQAVETAPTSARAHLGLGRIARIQFRRKTALDRFATAFHLDPRDPEILLAYSEYDSVPQARGALYAALSGCIRPHDPSVQQVAARLQIDRAAGSRLNRIVTPYRAYRLKLSPFLPANSTSCGVVLKASLNGGKPLRLVLDTGAKGIVLSGKSLRELGLAPIVDSKIGGIGPGVANSASVALVRSVEIGDLKLENCAAEVSGRSFLSGADGIIGTDLFQEFLISLDLWSQFLVLLPFPGYAPVDRSSDPWLEHDATSLDRSASATPVYHVGHLLALNTTVDRSANGLFVLDTGSAYNTVSPELLGGRRGISSSLVQGAQGTIGAQSATSRVEFRLSGGPTLIDSNVIALDLTGMSHKEGAKITGLLGYSALRKSTLTLNYRDGVVQFEPHNRR